MGRLGATMVSTHRQTDSQADLQAPGPSFLRLGNIRPPPSETDVGKEKAQETQTNQFHTSRNTAVFLLTE